MGHGGRWILDSLKVNFTSSKVLNTGNNNIMVKWRLWAIEQKLGMMMVFGDNFYLNKGIDLIGCINSRLYPIQISPFLYCICIIMWHSHLNDMEIPEPKHFIPRGFELGTTLINLADSV